MSLLVYAAGGALIGALVRWWSARLGWAWVAAYWLAAGAFLAAPLTTSRLQVPTDILYDALPWREMVPGPVVPANPLLVDVPLQMIPFRALVRDRLLHGEAPLWTHEIGTGEPLLGNAQSAPFSPLGLLTLPLPPVRELPVMVALKLFLSLLLTHCLLLELGSGVAGAVFAAIAFTFSVFSICWALHPHGMAAAWLPGIMLGLVVLRRGGRGGLAGLVACATGMALSGHPETLAHTGLAAALVAIGLLWAGGAARRRRFLAGLAAAAAITAGLTAPVLLPVAEALPEAIRSALVAAKAADVQPPPFAASSLRVLVDPLAFGSPRDGDFVATLNYNELCSGYAGLLALALAAAAAVALRGRQLAIVAGGGAALAAAFAIPPFLDLVRALPLLDHATNGRLRLLWVLAVAVATGLGLEELAARRAGRFAAAACAGAAALALAFDRQPQASWQRAWWLATIATCALTAAGFLALGARPPAEAGNRMRAGWLPWLAVACLALDLGLLEGRFLPVLPARFDLSPAPAIEELVRAQRSAAGEPFRVIGSAYDLTPNTASFYGLCDPRAYEVMQPARAAWVVRLMVRPEDMAHTHRAYPAPYLSFLGVRYMLTPHGERLGPPWQPSWDGRGGKLWRNPEALPLFFMPASWRLARDPRTALRSTIANHDFTALAIAEIGEIGAIGASGEMGEIGKIGASGERAGSARSLPPAANLPRQQVGAALIKRVSSNGFAVDVATPTGGLVASSVSFSRGWRLTLDDHAAPLVRVNGGFLGFLAPAGEHHASLEFRPAGWTWGLRLCAATLLGLLAFGALPAARRRARQPAVQAPGTYKLGAPQGDPCKVTRRC
jgi:hypothetical protein